MNGLGFGFWEVFDVREAFEVCVLGPKGRLVSEGGGVDEGIGHGGFVADADLGGGDGDGWVRGDDCSLLEEIDELLGAILVCVEGGVFPDLVEGDGGDDDGGHVSGCFEECFGVESVVGDFYPCGTVQADGFHNSRSVFSRSKGM